MPAETLRVKYRTLKGKYTSLKDEVEMINNDFKEDKDMYETKIKDLAKENLFLRTLALRYISTQELAAVRAQTQYSSEHKFKLPEFRKSNEPLEANRKTEEYSDSDGEFRTFTALNPDKSNKSNKSNNGYPDIRDEYFTLKKESLDKVPLEKERSISTGKKRFRPIPSPRVIEPKSGTSLMPPLSPRVNPKYLLSRMRSAT